MYDVSHIISCDTTLKLALSVPPIFSLHPIIIIFDQFGVQENKIFFRCNLEKKKSGQSPGGNLTPKVKKCEQRTSGRWGLFLIFFSFSLF